jgi:hypothetical protein
MAPANRPVNADALVGQSFDLARVPGSFNDQKQSRRLDSGINTGYRWM